MTTVVAKIAIKDLSAAKFKSRMVFEGHITAHAAR